MIDGERVYDCKKCHPDKLIATQRAFAKSSMHAEFDECKERCDKSPVDSVPAPVETANSNTKLPSCCVHEPPMADRLAIDPEVKASVVANAPVAAVKPGPPQMIHGLPAEKFKKAEELALQRIAEEKLAEDARELRRNAEYIYEVLKQEEAYETAVSQISVDIAKEMELLEKKKEHFIAETQRQHKAKLDRLRQNYGISQQ